MSVQEIVEVDGLGIERKSRIVLELNFRKAMLAQIVVCYWIFEMSLSICEQDSNLACDQNVSRHCWSSRSPAPGSSCWSSIQGYVAH